MSSPSERQRPLYDAGSHQLVFVAPQQVMTEPPFDSVDVKRLPGARVVALERLEDEASIAFAGCARGPSSRFAPGLEDVLFDRSKAMALQGLQIQLTEPTVLESKAEPRVYEQVIAGNSSRGPVRIHQLLTFAGEQKELLLCTVACAGRDCEETSLRIQGTPPDAPRPSLLVRAFFTAAEHPRVALGAFTAVVLAVIAWILWRRPRPVA